jgi:hypothetical protein
MNIILCAIEIASKRPATLISILAHVNNLGEVLRAQGDLADARTAKSKSDHPAYPCSH